VSGESSGRSCGLCGEARTATELARGRKLSICRDCVEAGLAATLRSTAGVRDGETVPRAYTSCSVCGDAMPPEGLHRGRADAQVCVTCLYESYNVLTQLWEMAQRRHAFHPGGAAGSVADLLDRHFGETPVTDVVTSTRTFPGYLRADLQTALDALWDHADARCFGVDSGRYSHETVTYASLLRTAHDPIQVAPLQYEDVDVGEERPVKCLRNAVWLSTRDGVPHAVLLSQMKDFGRAKGWHVEVCVPTGEHGVALSQAYFRTLERAIERSASYRGKVLSLEGETRFHGEAPGTVLVHRISPVAREDIILPTRTLELLERNVFDFVRLRDRLRELALPIKKGLLFYGPPGTGKTHTIRYLAGALPDHTTLLVTAEQIAHLRHYMALARLLSPAIVVIEDVDLVARDRGTHQTPAQESALNTLLNEMDGLRENVDVLFVLTTNNPQTLESALTGRPGRIDQAVEFPLPDAEGRARLVELYRRRLRLAPQTIERVVRRTEGVSASFMKELMRRTAQFALERDPASEAAEDADVEQAMNELLFDGGRLNAKLLGASSATVD
jgi:AAA+ superfamily predicted ATPase